MLHRFDIFLCLVSGGHDLVAAAQAFKPEVCAGAQALPALFAAGVGLFHGDDVADADIHLNSSLDQLPIAASCLLQLVGAVFIVTGVFDVIAPKS